MGLTINKAQCLQQVNRQCMRNHLHICLTGGSCVLSICGEIEKLSFCTSIQLLQLSRLNFRNCASAHSAARPEGGKGTNIPLGHRRKTQGRCRWCALSGTRRGNYTELTDTGPPTLEEYPRWAPMAERQEARGCVREKPRETERKHE